MVANYAGRASAPQSDPRVSPIFRCLGFRWRLSSDDPAIQREVHSMYESCVDTSPDTNAHTFEIHHGTLGSDRLVTLRLDHVDVVRHVPLGVALEHLVWAVNDRTISQSGERLLVHASAASRDGAAVLLPGPEGSGKSTLVTALVRAGLHYLTDETVAIDRTTGTVEPYPKPIALAAAGLAQFPDLAQAHGTPRPAQSKWWVPASALRADAACTSSCTPALVVFPSYRPELATALRPITRGQAAIALAETCFNFRASGPGSLALVGRVVTGCDCYRLDAADIGSARDAILGALDRRMRA